MIKRGSDKLFDIVNVALLGIVGLLTLFPVYYVVCLSFTSQHEYLKGGLILFPKGFTLENFTYMLSSSMFPRALGVSANLAVFGTLLSLLVTAMLAYALSRKRMIGRQPLLLLILFTTLFSPGMIPPYLLVRGLGLMDSIWALILPALSSGWNLFLLKSFFDNIPESLEEAAVIDGCNDFSVFWRIILPLSIPAMVTFGLFFAVSYWNVFFNALLYINDAKKWPLQMVLRQMLVESNTGDAHSDTTTVLNPQVFKMAGVVITIVPIMMVYPFLQKHFAKGVMVGAVKG
ncbi:MAG: transporter permease [Paenibacillaceae bacterium]|jgi:putative aldouronate transport system permease protein|nr:transporter permease [Paenibacillaceae bacterium]